jgi:hypothetical protein
MGTRGLTGINSMLLGSVSHAVLQHADRPVIVIPSPEVTRQRAAPSAEEIRLAAVVAAVLRQLRGRRAGLR